jgi:hypothetical protein
VQVFRAAAGGTEALMGFEFVDDVFAFPAFMITEDQVQGWGAVRV